MGPGWPAPEPSLSKGTLCRPVLLLYKLRGAVGSEELKSCLHLQGGGVTSRPAGGMGAGGGARARRQLPRRLSGAHQRPPFPETLGSLDDLWGLNEPGSGGLAVGALGLMAAGRAHCSHPHHAGSGCVTHSSGPVAWPRVGSKVRSRGQFRRPRPWEVRAGPIHSRSSSEPSG